MGRPRKAKAKKRPDGLWERPDEHGRMQYYDEGKYSIPGGGRKNYKTGWFYSIEEVHEKKERIIKYGRMSAEEKAKIKTVGDLIEEYLEWLHSSSNIGMARGSSHTHESYGATTLRTLPSEILKTRWFDIDRKLFQDWMIFYQSEYKAAKGKRKGENILPSTYDNYKKFVKGFIQWLPRHSQWARGDTLLVKDCLSTVNEEKYQGAAYYRKQKLKFERASYWDLAEFRKLLDQIPYAAFEYTPIKGPELKYKRLGYPELSPCPYLDWDEGLENVDDFIKNGKILKEVLAYTVFVLLFFQGLRFEELRALSWSDIGFDDRSLHVHNAKNYRASGTEKQLEEYWAADETTKNVSSIRDIYLFTPTLNALKTYRFIYEHAYGATDGLRFIPANRSKDGFLPPTSVQNWIDEYEELAEISHGYPHKFRHSCAMYLAVDIGLSKDAAASFLGHRDTKMLDYVYTHKDKLQKKAQVDKELQEAGIIEADWASAEEKEYLVAEITRYLKEHNIYDVEFDPE